MEAEPYTNARGDEEPFVMLDIFHPIGEKFINRRGWKMRVDEDAC